eukprot:gene8173-9607_t
MHPLYAYSGDDNTRFCLAWGRLSSDNVTPLPQRINEIDGKSPAEIACGSNHTVFITKGGDVYTMGANGSGQLGHGDLMDHVFSPIRRFALLKALSGDFAIKAAAGKDFTLVVTREGILYSWGIGDQGQLGLGDLSESIELENDPLQLLMFNKTTMRKKGSTCRAPLDNVLQPSPRQIHSLHGIVITQIACGAHHSMALTKDGVVYSFGANAHGQLGIGTTVNSHLPTRITTLPPIQLIACGSAHSLALSSQEESLYSWGKGSDGQLGLDSRETHLQPVCIKSFIKMGDAIVSIACGHYHSVALTTFHEVYSWGFSAALGLQGHPKEALEPRLVSSLLGQNVINVSCGFSHTLVSTDKGECFSFGVGEYGQLGEDNKNGQPMVISAIGSCVETVACDLFLELKGSAEYAEDFERSRAGVDTPATRMASTMRMIAVDLPRTFPTLFLFHRRGALHRSLQNILLAWSMYRPDIGYVQGMSYLAGLLCLYLDEYEAFVAFANMVNTHFFSSLFMMDVNQIVRHVKIFDVLFSKHLPALYTQFRTLGIASEHYLLEWLMTLFTKQLPMPLVSRIWDCVLIEGESFIYAAVIGILKCCNRLIMSSSFEEAIVLLRGLPQDLKEEALFDAIDTVHIPKYFKRFIERINQEIVAS